MVPNRLKYLYNTPTGAIKAMKGGNATPVDLVTMVTQNAASAGAVGEDGTRLRAGVTSAIAMRRATACVR